MEDPIDQRVKHIKLPRGFKAEIFAQVQGARQICYSSKGHILYVGTREKAGGKVFAVEDKNGDYIGDNIVTIAEGLLAPNGVAFNNGDLYVAEANRIIKFEDIDNHLHDPIYSIVLDGLPLNMEHGWKYIKFGPDGKLYVPIGAPCNICNVTDPYATINRMNADGSEF